MLAIENHQDFGSDELVGFCEQTRGVGICVDAGNTFPVAEAPLDFYTRVAPHVRHVHLKDYRVQATDEGYRLVRCAIGDGAVAIAEMLDLFAAHHPKLTAVLEPGALEARHVRWLTEEWWREYAPKSAEDLARCLAAARVNHLREDADARTPWEKGDEQRLFHQALAQVALADTLGYDYAWEVEHHFLDEYSHSSAPEVFLAAAAAQTSRIRLGHGIKQVIPNYNHPARTAECLATLDIISNGRVEFGIGEGATRLELGGF